MSEVFLYDCVLREMFFNIIAIVIFFSQEGNYVTYNTRSFSGHKQLSTCRFNRTIAGAQKLSQKR
jgi:hypothetical protein